MGWDDGAEIANVLQSNQRMDRTDMHDTRIQETPGSRLATAKSSVSSWLLSGCSTSGQAPWRLTR
jgi:hypothetical protein